MFAASAGCQWAGSRGRWDDAATPSLAHLRQLQDSCRFIPADACGARQLVAAVEVENQSSRECAAGPYFDAALTSARYLSSPIGDAESRQIAWQVHHSSLKGLLAATSARTSPALGESLVIDRGGRPIRIAISLHGFPWHAAEFQRLVVVESYETKSLTCVRRRPGAGVPVVILRCQRTGVHPDDRFLPSRSAFAATAVLRPCTARNCSGGTAPADATLELYNPHAIGAIEYGGRQVALAADWSAALAHQAIHDTPNVNPVTWFLNPGVASGEEGLYFLEPFQRGKIPIVFVHGLLSNPSTWIDMVNELRATPGFDQHFQIWAFRYSTGRSFLRAAADLRRALYEAAETVDPRGDDPALRATVLIGHSMGGLVSKLQVVESRDVLWRSVAARPIEHIITDEPTRRELAEAMFFEPHPLVRRVIFLATPHGGSSWATRPIGRMASALVRPDDQLSDRYQRLIASNPGVFASEVQQRLPTSIDMLEPSHPLLVAIRRLPIAACVHAHSVIGNGGLLATIEPSDGVVPVASARHGQVESEDYVDANHEHVHRDAKTIAKVRAILSSHVAEYSMANAIPTDGRADAASNIGVIGPRP